MCDAQGTFQKMTRPFQPSDPEVRKKQPLQCTSLFFLLLGLCSMFSFFVDREEKCKIVILTLRTMQKAKIKEQIKQRAVVSGG